MNRFRPRNFIFLLALMCCFARCTSQSEFETFLQNFPDMPVESGERYEKLLDCGDKSITLENISLADAKKYLRPLPKSSAGGYDDKWACGKFHIAENKTAALMAGCDPDLPDPHPNYYLYLFDQDEKLLQQVHLNKYPDPRMKQVGMLSEKGALIALFYQPLTGTVLRNTWIFDAEKNAFQPEMDELSKAEFQASYPDDFYQKQAGPGKVDPGSEKVLFSFDCDITGDGHPDELRVVQGKEFYPLLVRESDGKGGFADSWRNDKLIPVSEGTAHMTDKISCDAGTFSFVRIEENPWSTVKYVFKFDEELGYTVFHSIIYTTDEEEKVIDQPEASALRYWEFEEY